jgi:hypothetical protein
LEKIFEKPSATPDAPPGPKGVEPDMQKSPC